MNTADFLGPTSSDEEDPDVRYVRHALPKRNHIEEIPCQNDRCDQGMIRVNDREYYCSRECFHAKEDRDKLTDKTIKFKRVTIIGRGGTGLLRDRESLDNLKISVDNKGGRRWVTKVQNADPEFDLWKPKTKKSPKKRKQKEIKVKKSKEIDEEKRKLQELLGVQMEDSESNSSDSSDNDDVDLADNSSDDSQLEDFLEQCQGIFNKSVNIS